MQYEFKIKQNGIIVAKGFAPCVEISIAEMCHYALQYSKDGEIDFISVRRID